MYKGKINNSAFGFRFASDDDDDNNDDDENTDYWMFWQPIFALSE